MANIKSSLHSKAVIFDMDGTIVDNMSVHIDTWLIFIKQNGLQLSRDEFLERMHGNLREIISKVFELDPDDPKVMVLGQAKEKFYRDTYRGHIKEIPGFTDTLKRLNFNQVPCGLATMGDTPNIDLVIDELDIRSYFQTIIGGHQVNKGKPHPEIFERALTQLDRQPEDCLVVEDSLSGVESAVRAGIPVVGITTSHHSDELLDAGCIKAITDYNQVDLLSLI